MSNKKTIREEVKSSGFFTIEQSMSGWPGSGFNRAYTEVEARRVKQSDHDETQVQIVITEFKGNKDRAYSMHGSLTLTPEQARKLALAICPELENEACRAGVRA